MSRRRIRDIRHDELIEATITAVHQYGYTSVTMTEIADHAGSTAASINYYFGSKEKLLEATMRRGLTLLKTSVLDRMPSAKNPHDRLMALLDANFDDRLFTVEQCSLWVQFWGNAPYVPSLARLHRINRARVTSNFRAELRALLPNDRRETVREALQSYMDGVWLETAQSETAINAAETRAEARRVAQLLLDSES